MRKIVFGGAIAATMLLAAGILIRAGNVQIANAAPAMVGEASGVVDIRALEAKIDIAALPRFDLNHMD